jgi:hypothetical protein
MVRAERLMAEGKKPPAEELLRNGENCRAMAAHYAPMRTNPDTKQPELNPKHDPAEYRKWLADERDAMSKAAPFFSPRLSAVALQTAVLDKDKELRGDPRAALIEMILQMRDRDEIGQAFHAYLVDATEAAEMDVANIVEGVWTIPASRAKNSTPLAIPLNANMLATITSTRKSVTRGYIKPSAAVLKARELAKLALKRDAFDRWAERLREIIG